MAGAAGTQGGRTAFGQEEGAFELPAAVAFEEGAFELTEDLPADGYHAFDLDQFLDVADGEFADAIMYGELVEFDIDLIDDAAIGG
jgi:hypothetical protein